MEVYTEDGRVPSTRGEDEAFHPSDSDRDEAAELFADDDDDDQAEDWEEFGRWLDTLPHERFRSVTRAIDLVRDALADYRSESNLTTFMGWLDG